MGLLIITIVFAAFFDAIRDTCYSHYSTSVLRKLDFRFWNALESWRYAKRFLGMPLDAWHFAKSATYALLFLFPAVIAAGHEPVTGLHWIDVVLWWVLVWGVWGIVFNLFYGYLFREENKD